MSGYDMHFYQADQIEKLTKRVAELERLVAQLTSPPSIVQEHISKTGKPPRNGDLLPPGQTKATARAEQAIAKLTGKEQGHD